MKRRLRFQIYFTIIASLIAVVLLSGLLWANFGRNPFIVEGKELVGRLAYLSLPSATAPPSTQQKAIDRLAAELNIDVDLLTPQREFIAGSGQRIFMPNADNRHMRWWKMRRQPRGVWEIPLPDGRWLVAKMVRYGRHTPLLYLAFYLGLIALAVGLVAYPLVRRLTGRLERLQKGVERIGSGDLSARITVEGSDEVAALAQSFNVAAEKIEGLVGAHRMLLANASHELRTPLSRIRLGCEMLKAGPDLKRSEAIEADIAELDTLIDEILLMSRLDSGNHADRAERVDLVALVAEECAHYEDCTFVGSSPEISGDAKLLQRLIRNMIDNAYKHGAPPVTVKLSVTSAEICLSVSDAGEGIAENAYDKVFQPFYRASGKQNVKGYGLGLPLVRQIAEAHGGAAIFLPKSEHRSTIMVKLPQG